MRVFLSHCSNDKQEVARLGMRLLDADQRFSIWLDSATYRLLDPMTVAQLKAYGDRVVGINIGDDWSEKIQGGQGACDCVLVFWSSRVFTDYHQKRSVMQHEIKAGYDRKRLVQVRLDDCGASIHDPYKFYQSANLSVTNANRDVEFSDLVQAIVQCCQGAGMHKAGDDQPLRKIDHDEFALNLVDREPFDAFCATELRRWMETEDRRTRFLFITARQPDRPYALTDRLRDWVWSMRLERTEPWQAVKVPWIEQRSGLSDPHYINRLVSHWNDEARLVFRANGRDVRAAEVAWPLVYFCSRSAEAWSRGDVAHALALANASRAAAAEAGGAPRSALVVLVTVANRDWPSWRERSGFRYLRAAHDRIAAAHGNDTVAFINLESIGQQDALSLGDTLENARRSDFNHDGYRRAIEASFPKRKQSLEAAEKHIQLALNQSKIRKTGG